MRIFHSGEVLFRGWHSQFLDDRLPQITLLNGQCPLNERMSFRFTECEGRVRDGRCLAGWLDWMPTGQKSGSYAYGEDVAPDEHVSA
jgi:hypothetical protein